MRTLARTLVVTLLVLASAPAEGAEPRTERWYETHRAGQKSGYLHVVWAPSTWEGRKTIRDTTTMVSVTSRSMAGMRDRFESTIHIELERDADGRLWWQRVRVEEAGITSVEELRWTGTGYQHKSRRGDAKRDVTIPLSKPVMTDAEAFLGSIVRGGELKAGAALSFDALDLRRRSSTKHALEVKGSVRLEAVQGEDEDGIDCLLVVETQAESRAQTQLWLDSDGALVQLQSEDGTKLRRTTQAKAEAMPLRPAEYSITVAASPRLERIFGADRVLVDVMLQGDPDRRVPDFPTSPWGKTLSIDGDDDKGWTLKVELTKHGGTGEQAELPIDAERFADDLEPTVLMPTQDPRLQRVAAEVVGDERDARKAAYKLARYVYTSLRKESPQVAQASALEILEGGCGDCSEHALLFVALCRTAGIPARRCTGYVCVGSIWGAHAWSEIWTGEWIAADPTTGEIAPGARYLFFGYPERAGSFPGLVSSRVSGRMRLVTTRIEEGAGRYDLTDADMWRLQDHEGRRYNHVLAGLEAHHVPDDWTVRLSRTYRMRVTSPQMSADIFALASQGADLIERKRARRGAIETTFAGAPALTYGGWGGEVFEVFSRGRVVRIQVRPTAGGESVPPAVLARLETVLERSFTEPARSWDDDVSDRAARESAAASGTREGAAAESDEPTEAVPAGTEGAAPAK